MRILATLVIVASLASAFSLNANAQATSALNQNTTQNTKIQASKTDIDSKAENIDVTVPRNERKTTWQDNIVLAIYAPNVSKKTIVPAKNNSALVQMPKGDFIMNASAYTAAADECGKSDGITASGKKVAEGRTLACPKGYAFGTQIEIDGMGTYTCEDRGGAIKGNHFDIYMKTKSQAFAFGRRNLAARIVKS
jgi:3D (Asp-Asp-Asp) domain-containing protein